MLNVFRRDVQEGDIVTPDGWFAFGRIMSQHGWALGRYFALRLPSWSHETRFEPWRMITQTRWRQAVLIGVKWTTGKWMFFVSDVPTADEPAHVLTRTEEIERGYRA